MLLQLARCGRNKQSAITLIFSKKKHILLNGVSEHEDLDFISLRSFIEITNKVEIYYTIFKYYKRNLKTTSEKHLTSYH